MILRSIFFVTALAFASQGMAEDTKAEAGEEQEVKLTYCQQLGKTAGFEAEDLEEFVKECEEKRASDSKQG
jgi:Tfp pilus assembly protein PilO